jgi:hypothetical protein
MPLYRDGKVKVPAIADAGQAQRFDAASKQNNIVGE